MTIPDRLRPWIVPAGAVLVLLVAAGLWNYQHRQLLDARRAAEAAQLALKGQIVAEQESAKGLKDDVARLLAENADLRAAYDQARAAAPGAQPVAAGKLSTGPVPVEAPPREPPPTVATPAPTAPPVPAPACVLAAGDQGSIEVQQITLETEAGNYLIVGTADAWRETPPRARLFGGKFQAALSDTSSLAPPAPPRWGAGPAAVCFFSGCAFGAALALPPARILGLQLEATVGGLLGPQGPGVMGSGIVRW